MSKVLNLIEKLITSTDVNSIKWKPIASLDKSQNPKLLDYYKQHAAEYPGISSNLMIDDSRTFYINYNDGFIYLICKSYQNPLLGSSTFYFLAIQKDSGSRVMEQNSTKDYQSDLIRLFNIIERQLSGVDGFIDDFLDDPLI